MVVVCVVILVVILVARVILGILVILVVLLYEKCHTILPSSRREFSFVVAPNVGKQWRQT